MAACSRTEQAAFPRTGRGRNGGTFVRAIADQAADALAGRVIELDNGFIGRIEYEPLGVAAAIAPWNAPLTLGFAKIATALAAGNTVVLKPSPNTPLATARAVELVSRCLPPSVLEVVFGGAELGAELVKHQLVRKVSFTGSTVTGKQILVVIAGHIFFNVVARHANLFEHPFKRHHAASDCPPFRAEGNHDMHQIIARLVGKYRDIFRIDENEVTSYRFPGFFVFTAVRGHY